MDGAAAFENDIPLSEEPECKVPEDSNNSDHCAQYSELTPANYATRATNS